MLRPTYPIRTARLLLRPFAADDLHALHAIHSREDVTRYLYWGPLDMDQVRAMLARRTAASAIEKEGDALHVAAELRQTGAFIGHFNLQWLSREHRQGEIGFVMHPEHHGRGYATEAGHALLRLGFEELGLHRIIGRCDARNAPSSRVMERLGMRREAHFRENELVKGEWTDELVYAVRASEWAGMREPSPD